ncbi:hypothetical protein Btru_060682 [Bulinus truncatus]|nr:hypothetical protein Btru_060682 [Bulinus truncatus]
MSPTLCLLTLLASSLPQTSLADVYISTLASNQTKTAYTGLAYSTNFSTSSYVAAKFLGIPYAKPTTSSRRFTVPVINTPSGGQCDALKLGSICPQPLIVADSCIQSLAPSMNEDCLFLNIYVPLPNLTSADVQSGVNTTLPGGKKYPVLFYIHGGGFYLGSGNCYDGSILAGLGDIIVVTSNYRLGVLGFVSTGDDVIPDNLAMWDQLVALQWVHENIEAFGGDPGAVTVGGNSAGGIYSTLLALFPQPGPEVFQRIIALSGTSFIPKVITSNKYNMALMVANDLGCGIQGQSRSLDIKSCLMDVSVSNLTDISFPVLVPLAFTLIPVIGGPLIPKDPYDFLSNPLSKYKSRTLSVPASFYSKDLLIGITPEDGVVFYALRAYILSNALKNLTLFAELPSKTISLEDFKQIAYEFFAKNFTSMKLVEMLTDLYFTVPTSDTALAHVLGPLVDSSSNKGRTFVYKFSTTKTSPLIKGLVNWFEGTDHDSDIPFIFGAVSSNDDVNFSKIWMTYMSNFVKTGNPNQQGLVHWKEYEMTNKSYIHISTNFTQQKDYFGASIVHFLYEFIPSLKESTTSSSNTHFGNLITLFLITLTAINV